MNKQEMVNIILSFPEDYNFPDAMEDILKKLCDAEAMMSYPPTIRTNDG